MPERKEQRKPRRRSLGSIGFVVVSCLWVALLCSAHIDQMFLDGHLGYAGALRGVIGQNYLRHDPFEIRFAPLHNGGPTHDDPPSVRFNHPPLTGMLVGLSFAIFDGASEAAARVVPIAASIMTVPFLFGWVRRIWGFWTALVALALWCTAPFVAIYGAMVSYEPLVLCAWNLLLWAWTAWRWKGPTRGPLVAGSMAVFLGVWTDWPMVVLALGVIGAEAALVAARHPRRPAFLSTMAGALIGGLGSLALYYFIALDIDSAALMSLFEARSSLGRWSAWDAFIHIGHRTAVLLTWPLVIASLLGSVAVLRGRGERSSKEQRPKIFFAVALLAPPLSLLLLLPQHAVIHCFSSWYLLPAVVAASAVMIIGVLRYLKVRFGTTAAYLAGGAFSALLLWQAVPIVLDGWISDGSPQEGRPRIDYRHLVLSRWLGEQTGASDHLLVDVATGAVGVRAWFLHGRQAHRLEQGSSLERALSVLDRPVVLLSRDRVDVETLRRLSRRHSVTIVDEAVVVDTRMAGHEVDVLELVEEPPTWWWALTGSACYPPHRLEVAPGRAAVYREQLFERSALEKIADVGSPSLAELAARHLLIASEQGSESIERSILEEVTVRVDEPLCPELEWVGVAVDAPSKGRARPRILLRALKSITTPPRIRAELMAAGTTRPSTSWTVVPDDIFTFPESSFLVASHWLPIGTVAGSYRIELRACGRSVSSSPIDFRHAPRMPVLPPVGRL